MFQIDKRGLYIVLAIFVVYALTSYMANPDKLLALILTLPAVLIAITFHEYAHAFAADKLGDDTARRQGRLTLNPFDHLDPYGTILLIFAGFGWGKPVEISPRNFNRKVSLSAGEAIVSLAGPLMNLFLAILFSILYCAILKFAPNFILETNRLGMVIMTLLSCIISVNIGLGIFNLIPLPPLDGSKILKHFLPYDAKDWFDRNASMFYIVFLVLWITGIAGILISPIINITYDVILGICAKIFGI